MAVGLVTNEQAGTNSVNDRNPLPIKIGDGTRIVDVTNPGATGTLDGVIAFGKDTAGTHFPLPLYGGGLAFPPFDNGTKTINGAEETYIFLMGTVTVGTLIMTYTDSNRTDLASWQKL